MYKYMKCVNVAILTKHDASSLLTYAALHLLPHIYFHATAIFQHTTSFVISKRLGLKVDCLNTSWCIINVWIVSWISCWRLLYYFWRRTSYVSQDELDTEIRETPIVNHPAFLPEYPTPSRRLCDWCRTSLFWWEILTSRHLYPWVLQMCEAQTPTAIRLCVEATYQNPRKCDGPWQQ